MTSSPALHARVASLFVACILFVLPQYAEGQDSCEARLTDWASSCAPLRSHCPRAELCPPGSMVVTVGCTRAESLRIEITPASPRGFRRVGELSISPIGEFPDWNAAPAPLRDHFEQFASCLSSHPTLLAAESSATAGPPTTTASPHAFRRGIPWLMLCGLALAALAMLCDPRTRTSRFQGELVGLLALTIATWCVRQWLVPSAVFHQNGQGPMWVGFALQPEGGLSPYGPGYWELFHEVARALRNPDATIRHAQSLAAACVPALAWIIARGAGADRRVCAAITATLAFAPVLARVAQSESYYATCGTLLVAAGGVLAVGATSAAKRSVLALSVLAAACFVAQAARVNPVCWIAAAFVPAVVLNGRVRPWTVVLSAAIVGLVVAGVTGRALLAVLRGSLGHRWLPQALNRPTHLAVFATVASLSGAVLVGLARDWRRAVRPIATLVLASVALEATRLIARESVTVNEAYASLWLPVFVSSAAGWSATLRTAPRLTAAAIAAAGMSFALLSYTRDTTLATDVMECSWAETWRERVPRGSVVVYGGQGATYVLTLPLYGAAEPHHIEPWVLTGGTAPPPELQRLNTDVYYYESSLCATREARGTCAAMRERYSLVPVVVTTFPARTSMTDLQFETQRVAVGLYRVIH